MQDALDYARKYGNKLMRYPGGFWCQEGLSSWSRPWFGTSTVEALVTRGVGEYTQWVDGKHGRFPVEMTVVEKFRLGRT
jgi:hypothetical protein